jgi:spore coat protein X
MKESRVWQGERPAVQDVNLGESRHREWNALDSTASHPLDDNTQEIKETIKSIQESYEQIIIKDSADVEVNSTDTQAAISLQAAIQAAITLVISISIADSSKAEQISQELLGKIKTQQTNRQQTYIENSRGVTVNTTDTDLIVNVQLLLQVLLALVVKLDIL